MTNETETYLYLVCRHDWEYNDEYFYHTDGVHPRESFLRKEEAERRRDELELGALRGISGWHNYVGGGYWSRELRDDVYALLGPYRANDDPKEPDEPEPGSEPVPGCEWVEEADLAVEHTLPDAVLRKLAALLEVQFYCVYPVPLRNGGTA